MSPIQCGGKSGKNSTLMRKSKIMAALTGGGRMTETGNSIIKGLSTTNKSI